MVRTATYDAAGAPRAAAFVVGPVHPSLYRKNDDRTLLGGKFPFASDGSSGGLEGLDQQMIPVVCANFGHAWNGWVLYKLPHGMAGEGRWHLRSVARIVSVDDRHNVSSLAI
ncbi:hypothetical protein Ais01nite_19480 [Asanoa ishikariensis]|nr:hypothetical protein Ais01nite_19480 [Asanoa ishikariensis]